MKILFTVFAYYPSMGGVQNVTKYLAEGLAKLGHDVTVITCKKPEDKRNEIINSVKIYRYILKKTKLGVKGEIDEYINFIKNFGFDIMINTCTECVTTDVLLNRLNEIEGKKILHIHGCNGLSLKLFSCTGNMKNNIGNTYNYIMGRIYFGKFYKYLSEYKKIICLSQVDSGKKYMEKYKPNDVVVLENAADDMFFEECVEEKRKIDNYVKLSNKDYVVSVANYLAIKNQKFMIKAFYKSDAKNIALILIGKNKTSYYNKLIKIKEKYEKNFSGKKEIYILTGVDRNDIPNIIRNSKIYLVSSIVEQYSISIIEAMASKIPFISTNVGNAYILPGGKIITNPTQMSNEIDNLLKNEKKRIRIGKEGKEYADNNCKIEIAVNKLNEIINKVNNEEKDK